MEAVMFTGWIIDFLELVAAEPKVALPGMVKAIAVAKNTIELMKKMADLLRVNLLPECTMVPTELRELRLILRYRNMIVRRAVTMKNKMAVCCWKLACHIWQT